MSDGARETRCGCVGCKISCSAQLGDVACENIGRWLVACCEVSASSFTGIRPLKGRPRAIPTWYFGVANALVVPRTNGANGLAWLVSVPAHHAGELSRLVNVWAIEPWKTKRTEFSAASRIGACWTHYLVGSAIRTVVARRAEFASSLIILVLVEATHISAVDLLSKIQRNVRTGIWCYARGAIIRAFW